MTVLIVYSTIEGQTGKIAEFVADRLRDAGETAQLLDADETDEAEFADVDRVVLAAPVHERRHPRAFEAFLTAHAGDLKARPTMLLSVSLSAAFPEGMEEAQDYVDEMTMRTNLEPTEKVLVAGAIRGGAYDYYSQQVLKHVVLGNRDFDPSTVTEHEFTDWNVLAAKLDAFLAVPVANEA